MQYIFSSGDTYTFMDQETYEQIEIPAERLE
jgi:elongation factor P